MLLGSKLGMEMDLLAANDHCGGIVYDGAFLLAGNSPFISR
jgi:hypothetical protein